MKEQEEVVNVDDHKENVSEEIILQDEEHNDNIDLDEVDYHRWWKWWKEIFILTHMSYIITFKFNQFECLGYKHIYFLILIFMWIKHTLFLIYLVSFVEYYYISDN